MNKIMPIIGFGVGILVLGLYWQLFNDVLLIHISQYFMPSYVAFGTLYVSDKYFEFMYMLWRIMPWICMFVGLLLLVSAGAGTSNDTEGDTE